MHALGHAHSIKINYILYNSLDDALFLLLLLFFILLLIIAHCQTGIPGIPGIPAYQHTGIPGTTQLQ